MVNEFIQVEDVTLTQKSGESLTTQICSTISYGQWIFTGGRCDFKPDIRGCLKWHKYLLQPAKINEFLQVENGTLIQKFGGVLNNKHLLANQLKLSIFYSNWEIQGCLRCHKCTLKNQGRQIFYRWKMWIKSRNLDVS